MTPWRGWLLVAVLAGTLGGYAWLFRWSPADVRPILVLFASAFVLGIAATHWHYRSRLTPRLVTANLAIGSIVHLAVAGVVVGGHSLGQLGLLPALEAHWMYFLAGVLGLAAAYFTWTRARGGDPNAPRPAVSVSDGEPEPAPPPAESLERPPDWAALATAIQARGHVHRLETLRALERIEAALDRRGRPGPRIDQALRILRQEAARLDAASAAEVREADEEDVLTQTAELLEWGVQKLPELAELDASDLMMGKTVADIRAQCSAVERVFIDHRQLKAIHRIDRQTAEEKCDQRAAAARAALPALRANGMRLSEELIATEPALSAYKSVTGFQVVSMGGDEGYVTFEGNGRREAIKRAFGEDEAVLVECRLYRFADDATRETIRRRVRRTRRWKKVED